MTNLLAIAAVTTQLASSQPYLAIYRTNLPAPAPCHVWASRPVLVDRLNIVRSPAEGYDAIDNVGCTNILCVTMTDEAEFIDELWSSPDLQHWFPSNVRHIMYSNELVVLFIPHPTNSATFYRAQRTNYP